MATESVKRILGLQELIGDLHGFSNPKEIISAAENVHFPVMKGIEAIGDLLWFASLNEDFCEAESTRYTLGNLGLLLKHLSDTAELAHFMHSNAAHDLQKQVR